MPQLWCDYGRLQAGRQSGGYRCSTSASERYHTCQTPIRLAALGARVESFAMIVLGILFTSKHEATATVAGPTWQREI